MMLLFFGGATAVAESIAGAGGRLVFKPRRLGQQQPRPIVTEDARRNQTEMAGANATHKAKKIKTGGYG